MPIKEITKKIEHGEELIKSHDYAQALSISEEILAGEFIQKYPLLHVRTFIILIDSLWRQGKNQRSLSMAEIALKHAEKLDPSEGQTFIAKILKSIGIIHYNIFNHSKALEYYNKAIELNKQIEDKQEIASNLTNIGLIYTDLADYSRALDYYNQSLKINEEIDNKKGIATSLSNIGPVYYQLADYFNALKYSNQALEIHQQINDRIGIGRNLSNISNVYLSLSEYTRTLECLAEALEISEQIGDQPGIALNLGNIGNVYTYLADFPRAIEYYQRAIEIYDQIENKDGRAINLSNLGIAYTHLSDFPRALEYFTEALAINEQGEFTHGVVTNLVNIAHAYQLNDNYTAAFEYLQKAESLSETINAQHLKTSILFNLGSLYAESKFRNFNLEKAEEFLFRSLKDSEKLGVKNISLDSIKKLSTLYQSQERWKEAFEFKLRQEELEAEINKEETEKQTRNMEYKRQIEESERDRQVKIARFQEQEKILLNILPEKIANRMLDGENQIADIHEEVSIFFSDIVGFTKLTQQLSPEELLTILNELFSEFDNIALRHGLEKIKTIGDAYMAVAGVPEYDKNHAKNAAAFAIDVLNYMTSYHKNTGREIQVRIGLHSGKAIAGIVGETKFAYDLWGDSINTASRMESHGEAGKIHVSEDFKNALGKNKFHFVDRGELEIKGKGKMKTFFLEASNF